MIRVPKVRKQQDEAKSLEPYLSSGLDLSSSGDEATGECPFCGKPDKFSVNVKTGMYRCWSCATGTARGGGNAELFVEKLWEQFDQGTSKYDSLARLRGLDAATVMQWGACWSPLLNCWMVPGYNAKGKVRQLYRYVGGGNKHRLLGTTGLPHGLFGVNLYDHGKSTVYLCEGLWDAMALWEVLRAAKWDIGTGCKEQELVATYNLKDSLLSDVNVLAVPGCNVFKEQWCSLFGGKDVYLCFDNDHPRKNPKTGRVVPPGVLSGLKRIAGMLAAPAGRASPASSIQYLHWGYGTNTYHDRGKPHGYDLGDAVGRGKISPLRGLAARIDAFSELQGRMVPVPTTWLKRSRGADFYTGGLAYTPCISYKDLVNSWRKALQWTDGLDHALATMLAVVSSTKLMGDQIWIKLIGPPGCGKSTLCEAFSVNKRYIYSKSTLKGFHSGWKDEDGQNASLITRIRDKTLVTKDGDTLLQAPNLLQILSEARDLFDRVSRSDYRNKMGMDHEAVNMTWILAGTSALRSIDSSELGERFLDCVLMEEIDLELEREVLWRKVHSTDRNLSIEVDGKGAHEPELLEAMRKTAGYINHLRENVVDGMETISCSTLVKRRIVDLSLFVAYTRARPSQHQKEKDEREFGARLAGQHIRLAKCSAFVLNKDRVDDEVLTRVRRISMDTGRGKSLEIIKVLYEYSPEGIQTNSMALKTGMGHMECLNLMKFLKGIGVLETYTPRKDKIKQSQRWRLTKVLHQLYESVL